MPDIKPVQHSAGSGSIDFEKDQEDIMNKNNEHSITSRSSSNVRGCSKKNRNERG